MESQIQQFIEEMKTPTGKLSVTKLRQREELWRSLFNWLDEEVKYYLFRTGSLIRLVGRDYKGRLGELGAIKWKIDEMDVMVEEKQFDYTAGKYIMETKVLKISDSVIAWKEFILSQANVEDDPEPSLEAVGDESCLT